MLQRGVTVLDRGNEGLPSLTRSRESWIASIISADLMTLSEKLELELSGLLLLK